MFGYVVEFFEHRQIAIALNVAHCSGIAVPIPSASEISAALNYTNVGETRLTQPSTHQEATESATDNRYFDFVEERIAFHGPFVWVIYVFGELSTCFDVLLVVVISYALVAL